jgi:predicted HicB family RNase H-like nuclease
MAEKLVTMKVRELLHRQVKAAAAAKGDKLAVYVERALARAVRDSAKGRKADVLPMVR